MIRNIPIFFPLSIVILISACQPAPIPAATPTVDATLIREAWQKSPHANTYDVGKGPNTYCARCHSPRNWDPAAKADPPPNCVSCKFPFDPAMRIAKSNPPVAKSDWRSIGCEICHKTENGATLATTAWLNTVNGQYEPISKSTALCEKCHTDTEAIKHQRDLGTGAHKDYTCTHCHNAHSTTASCTAQACHPNVLTASNPIAGHDKSHQTVSCIACHDASGMTVGIEKGKGMWITFRTTELLGQKTSAAYQSHNLARAADCLRCHAPNNPWGLKTVKVESR
jgi:hypothetical protein